MKKDYESRTRKNRFLRLLKISLITILICIAVLAPLLWYWGMSLQMRSALRNGKNILLNAELLSIQYNGLGEPLLDSSRQSGLSADAEEEIRDFSGADGIIRLSGWDKEKGRVLSMTYREGKFLLIYEYSEKEDSGFWSVYRNIRQYETS